MARYDGQWIAFKGVESTELGVRVARLPDVPLAEARGKAMEIPGRDGALWLPDDALRPVTLVAVLELGPEADPDAVAAWLSGSGALTLSSQEDHYWRARVAGTVEWTSGIYAGGTRRAEVAFSCQPFRYQVGDPALPPFTGNATFRGRGTWPARPEVTVYGAGSVDLMINGTSVLIDGIDDHITLDCEAMMATRDGVNCCPQVTLASEDEAWPELTPDLNRVSWSVAAADTGASGRVDRVIIRPRWRWR